MNEAEEYGNDRTDTKFKPGNKAASGRGGNKVSTKVKESIVNFLERNIDAIQESFDELKPKEKLEFIASIIPYAAPKLSSTQIEAEVNAGITIRFEDPGDYIYPATDKSDSGIPESI
jgi:hypothetical protein